LLLFINNGTQKLFDFAIIESGPAGYTIPTLAEFEKGYDTIFREVGCERNSDLINCMKKVPAKIFANNTLCLFAEAFPVIDGKLFQYQPAEAVRRGLISRVPVLLGTTTNEVFLLRLSYREHFLP
jgi:carboxylesterase type B